MTPSLYEGCLAFGFDNLAQYEVILASLVIWDLRGMSTSYFGIVAIAESVESCSAPKTCKTVRPGSGFLGHRIIFRLQLWSRHHRAVSLSSVLSCVQIWFGHRSSLPLTIVCMFTLFADKSPGWLNCQALPVKGIAQWRKAQQMQPV